ncbi:MAG: DNA polymerase IV, partial [Promethearchaeota archaeon]
MHCDLDCFYASIEIRDHLELKGKPVIIGADPKEGKGRGVVLTCSYEAREFGLHSGMPISQAYQRCPHGMYLRPNFDKYSKASKRIMQIIKKYSDKFQQVGIDESYINVSDICFNYDEVTQLAEQIRRDVKDNVGVNLSVGCSFTKSLAKIGSGIAKPNGISVLKPENFKEKLKYLDITRIPGIGKKSKIHYYNKGIKKIGDIIAIPPQIMIEKFGKHGKWVWNIVNGFDNRNVMESSKGRKSVSTERTFFTDTNNFNVIFSRIEDLNERLHDLVIIKHITYKTITLKIRFEGFKTFTRSKTLPFPIQDKKKVIDTVLKLYDEFSNTRKKIRLVGIKLSNLEKNLKVKQTNLISYVKA